MSNRSLERSIRLTNLCITLFSLVLGVLCISAPWLFGSFIRLRGPILEGKLPHLLTSFYLTVIPAACVLYDLRRMLCYISEKKVFTVQNTAILRRISCCCAAAGLVCLVSSFYYISFAALAVCGGFLALVLRVLAAVFEQAVNIKQENDYTI